MYIYNVYIASVLKFRGVSVLSRISNEREMSKTLTPAQFERSERNRQKALLLRDSRLSKKPYSDPKRQAKARKEEIDSGAGFLIDPDEEEERERTVRLVESQGIDREFAYSTKES